MRVQVEFHGEPFDRAAVLHTLRHLGLRAGWTMSTTAGDARIVYATTDTPIEVGGEPRDLVILSSRSVRTHLETSREPIPLEGTLPFVHPRKGEARENQLTADVVAGAFAIMNLWYETRTRGGVKDGWIRANEDWWARRGLERAEAFADCWLDEIVRVAERIGWKSSSPPQLSSARFTVILTHDVDYLPGPRDHGVPRFTRACARQVLLRRRLADALRLTLKYKQSWRRNPYWTLDTLMAQERARDARSSFQFVAAREHRLDPAYNITSEKISACLRRMAASEWEVCLHGSYCASRKAGQLAREKRALEQVAGSTVCGHRQHYLNFYPPQLYAEVERAGFAYDMSVGYNDAVGARAGTFFPFRPYGVDEHRAYSFWEIPFVVMDTTLATQVRNAPEAALERARTALEPVIAAGGCVGVIWHAEQSSGVLDPGYEQVYVELMDWMRANGGVLVSGRTVVAALNARWDATWSDE